MKIYLTFINLLFVVCIQHIVASSCGCKTLRPCYKEMLDTLVDQDEVPCIEDAAIGTSTVTIFLKALKQFCGEIMNVTIPQITYEGRHLYQVTISSPHKEQDKEPVVKPIILVEAGQLAGSESVMLALYVIEQLVACQEYNDMINKVRWIVLPSTNPDGQEYARYSRIGWKKNVRPADDQMSFGVDISRNFDNQWSFCPRVDNGFSPIFPGLAPASENETIFIKSVLTNNKKDIKVYLSIRRNGNSILYPYGYTKHSVSNSPVIRVANEVTMRVNQRTSSIHIFVNSSIYEFEAKAHCGHSVDYAYDLGIPLAYEMRVFLGLENRIMSKFQSLPRGYETSLRNGYFSGIRELYNAVTNEKKYGRLLK